MGNDATGSRMSLAAKYRDRIQEEWHDEDGHWVALKSGWQDNANPQCHTIHEDTQRECYELVRGAIPCNCVDCNPRARCAIHDTDFSDAELGL